LAYEESERFGYKVFYRTLEEYRKALVQPSWKYTLGYETKWMTRDEIVETTYKAALLLNCVKAEFGLIDSITAKKVEERIKSAIEMVERIDLIMKEEEIVREEKLKRLKPEIDQLSISTVCEKDEIKWPVGGKRFNYFAIIKDLLFGMD